MTALRHRLLATVPEASLVTGIVLTLLLAAGLVGNPLYRFVKVDGGSMEPTIHRGDVIVTTPVHGSVDAGTVVVLAVGDRLITHRVVSTSPDGAIVTRGDANPVPDQWGDMRPRIVGIYVATVPWLGQVLPIPDTSAAAFADSISANSTIRVGSWETPPTPEVCAGMRFDQVIVGGPGPDHIVAGNRGALIFGMGGDDVLVGGNGKDCLVGGDGNDTLSGGNGKDVLLGGDGDDRLAGGEEDDNIGGGNGKDRLDGGPGTDSCDGGRGADSLVNCESAERRTQASAPPSEPSTSPDDVRPAPPAGTPSPSVAPPATGTPEPALTPTLPPATPTPATTDPPTSPPTATPTPEPTPSAEPSAPAATEPTTSAGPLPTELPSGPPPP